MFAFRDKIVTHIDELAEILSSEHGKTLEDAKGEIYPRSRGSGIIACGIPQLLKGEYNQNVANGVDTYLEHAPAAGCCRWYHSFQLSGNDFHCGCFPVAIACGNTFVPKPSERDPSTGLRLAELFIEAGAPPGVLNVINGDKEDMDTIQSNPRVQGVRFVGSTAIGDFCGGSCSSSFLFLKTLDVFVGQSDIRRF